MGVLARSPLYVVVMAAIFGGWGAAAYEWLWLPESSALVLILAFLWIVVLAAIAVAIVAFTTAGASAAATGVDSGLRFRASFRFGSRRFAPALAILAVALALAIVGGFCFGWLNDHALNVASFLSLHLRIPVSYMLVGKILWTVEFLVWIFLAGVLMTWLLTLSSAVRTSEKRVAAQPMQRPARAVKFLTGLLGVCIFGGLAWLIAIWHPLVKPGFWDYTQLAIRIGAALLLISLGWLFWTLAFARLTLPLVTDPAAGPTPS